MPLFPYRTVLVLLAGSALSACAGYTPFEVADEDMPRPNYATRLPAPGQPTAAQPAPDEAPMPSAPPPSTPVESTQLPSAPPAYQPPAYQPPASQPPPAPAYTPPSPPQYKTVVKTSIAGKVVDVDGAPKTYKIEKGDTLIGASKKLGATTEEIAKLNKLEKPYLIKPGQTLKGPASKAKAYVVGQGDTLYAIARRFTVPAQAIADENDIEVGTSLRVGQKLRLPDGFKDKGPTKTETRVEITPPAAPAPRPAPSVYQPPVQPPPAQQPPPQPVYQPPVAAPPVRQAAPPVVTPRPTPPTTTYPPVTQPPVTRPPVQPAPKPTPASPPPVVLPSNGPMGDQQISQLGRGRFVWPLKGDIISDFGPKGTGQRNDGVNIRATAGEAVRSAAAGDVVYAGDQVPGFGNLVLVKHTDGWVTAYGHLARIDVKMQQRVVQGQQLGQAGASGGVGEPQLHFEVRYAPSPADRARPIDPRLVLPR